MAVPIIPPPAAAAKWGCRDCRCPIQAGSVKPFPAIWITTRTQSAEGTALSCDALVFWTFADRRRDDVGLRHLGFGRLERVLAKIGIGYERNNAWPDPFNEVDAMAVITPFETMKQTDGFFTIRSARTTSVKPTTH